MPHCELSNCPIDYIDTGGSGPVLVFVHGLLMDSSLWDQMIDELAAQYRCIAPTLPFGAHQRTVPPDVDLSVPAVAAMLAEFLDRLDVDDVVLVGNDTGGAVVQLLAADGHPRVGRVVLASCDAFDNYPPGLTGKTLVLSGKLSPTLFGLFMQQLRLRPARRLPIAFGWLTKRGDAAVVRWLQPLLHHRDIRRDTVRLLRSISADTDLMTRVAERLTNFDKPALIVWATQDRVMPLAHAQRLAALLPNARVVEIADSYTLLPLDQPAMFAAAIRQFTH